MTAGVKPAMSRAERDIMREYRGRVRRSERADGGLLPFQSAFVAAVSRKEKPAGVLALSVPTRRTAKVVVMRRFGGAVTDAGRSAVRGGR